MASRQVDSRGRRRRGRSSARVVDLFAGVVRKLQSGYLYHYAFAMILGLIVLLAVLLRYWT